MPARPSTVDNTGSHDAATVPRSRRAGRQRATGVGCAASGSTRRTTPRATSDPSESTRRGQLVRGSERAPDRTIDRTVDCPPAEAPAHATRHGVCRAGRHGGRRREQRAIRVSRHDAASSCGGCGTRRITQMHWRCATWNATQPTTTSPGRCLVAPRRADHTNDSNDPSETTAVAWAACSLLTALSTVHKAAVAAPLRCPQIRGNRMGAFRTALNGADW